MNKQPEVWLRGPISDVPPLLQPVAHALRQAQEEIHELMRGFPSRLLWEKPAEMASPAFHLQHIAGVLDRMMSYAKGEALTEGQFAYLQKEGKQDAQLSTEGLIMQLDLQLEKFLEYVSGINTTTLTEHRGVGRAQLPSTVGGLLFHAAEHCQRHLGQMLVTVKVILSR